MQARGAINERGGRLMGLHVLGALVGTWLIFSALAWPATHAERLVTGICGAVAFGLALLSIVWQLARYLNAALATVLVLLTVALFPRVGLTFWNNGFSAMAILALSLFDGARS
jgi:hypothetical protein